MSDKEFNLLPFDIVSPVKDRKKRFGEKRSVGTATIEKSERVLIPCKLKSTVYDNGTFKILSVRMNGASTTAVPECVPDDWLRHNFVVSLRLDSPMEFISLSSYIFSGMVVEHEQYGLQFSSDFAFEDEPSDLEMMSTYLSTLPNIGPERAGIILREFDVKELPGIFEHEPERLLEIPGINERRLPAIIEKWEKDRNLRRIYYWLSEHKVPVEYGMKILKEFGDKAIEILEQNPYKLAGIRGIGFPRADSIAHRILPQVPRGMRLKACGEHILRDAGFEGHLCLPYPEFKDRLCKQLAEFKISQEDADAVPDVALSEFVVVRNGTSNVSLIYDPKTYAAERDIAFRLVEISSYESPYICEEDDLEHAEDEYERNVGRRIVLDDCQREAVKSAFNHKLTVITGGGGTGKSTICRCIRAIAQKNGQDVVFMAPTGQAAKVLEQKTGYPASTIHRALGLTPDGVRELQDIRADIVVIDEFSMVGIDTLPYLLAAIVSCRYTNIVVVGDPQQLPSVASGNFLADLIASGIASVQKLEHIHRHSDKSYIARIANTISSGEVPDLPTDAEDFMWVTFGDLEDAADKAASIVNKYLAAGRMNDVQALSPMYRSPAGVDAICRNIQQMTSSGDVFEYKNKSFYVGDRVMQLVNNYDKEVFNGTIGNVVRFGFEVVRPDVENVERQFVVVDYDGESKMYIGDEIDEIRVCWCSTVHKFQGSQSPIIIFVMTEANMRMMTRELVYTALTRASEKVYFIGSFNMLCLAARRSEIKKRYSSTANLIRWKLEGLPSDITVLNTDKIPKNSISR